MSSAKRLQNILGLLRESKTSYNPLNFQGYFPAGLTTINLQLDKCSITPDGIVYSQPFPHLNGARVHALGAITSQKAQKKVMKFLTRPYSLDSPDLINGQRDLTNLLLDEAEDPMQITDNKGDVTEPATLLIALHEADAIKYQISGFQIPLWKFFPQYMPIPQSK